MILLRLGSKGSPLVSGELDLNERVLGKGDLVAADEESKVDRLRESIGSKTGRDILVTDREG